MLLWWIGVVFGWLCWFILFGGWCWGLFYCCCGSICKIVGSFVSLDCFGIFLFCCKLDVGYFCFWGKCLLVGVRFFWLFGRELFVVWSLWGIWFWIGCCSRCSIGLRFGWLGCWWVFRLGCVSWSCCWICWCLILLVGRRCGIFVCLCGCSRDVLYGNGRVNVVCRGLRICFCWVFLLRCGGVWFYLGWKLVVGWLCWFFLGCGLLYRFWGECWEMFEIVLWFWGILLLCCCYRLLLYKGVRGLLSSGFWVFGFGCWVIGVYCRRNCFFCFICLCFVLGVIWLRWFRGSVCWILVLCFYSLDWLLLVLWWFLVCFGRIGLFRWCCWFVWDNCLWVMGCCGWICWCYLVLEICF